MTTQLDLAPVTVVTPWGETLEPVRARVLGDRLTVETRDGTVLASDMVRDVQQGRRTAFADGEAGRWQVREACGCNTHGRTMRRQWAGTPRVADPMSS